MEGMIEAIKVHISVACPYKRGGVWPLITFSGNIRESLEEVGGWWLLTCPSPAPTPCDPPWFHLHLSSIFNVFLPLSTVSTAKWTMLLFGPTQPALFYISFLHIPYLEVRAQPPFLGLCAVFSRPKICCKLSEWGKAGGRLAGSLWKLRGERAKGLRRRKIFPYGFQVHSGTRSALEQETERLSQEWGRCEYIEEGREEV